MIFSGLEKNPGLHCEELNRIAKAQDYGEHYACPVVGGQSLRENLDKYVEWTKAAVKTIREIDPHRIIILGSPRKTGKLLFCPLSCSGVLTFSKPGRGCCNRGKKILEIHFKYNWSTGGKICNYQIIGIQKLDKFQGKGE